MRIKKLAVALAICVAFGAVAATAAQATLAWTVGEAEEVLSSETIDAFVNPLETWDFETKIAGSTVDIVAEGLSCSGAGECTVFGAGKSKLKLTFTKVSVTKPEGCAVEGGTFTTKALKGQVFMSTSPLSVYDKLEPAEGPVFFSVGLTGCALAGKYAFQGSLVGETTNPTGSVTPDWMLKFDPQVQSTIDPEGGLKVGTQSVSTKGAMHNELIGANKGAKWGVME
ncbi:MAG TPA: hypothetical protein VGI17_16145 [Solirubrobacterales bacterium]|jgi:hypothetical protein